MMNQQNKRSFWSLLLFTALLIAILLSSGVIMAQEEAPSTTEDEPYLILTTVGVPKLKAPIGKIYVKNPKYQWTAVKDASKYHYQVYQGSTKILDKKVTTTEHKPGTALAFAKHKWRVRALVRGEWGAWSAYREFTVINPVPRTKNPTGTISTDQPTYTWSKVNGATNYQYQVYEGATKVVDKTVTNTNTHKPNTALAYAAHKWRVRAYAGGAWRKWSAYKNFTVVPATFTTRVSVDSSGTQANDGSYFSAISADGRYVAFHSSANNLVAGDTNGFWDIFVHDQQTGATTRVSVDSSGAQGNSGSYHPAISADGRYVAFFSSASNLVAGDNNGVRDIFVHDQQTGATSRVSVDSSGAQGNNGSDYPAISADGRYVAFQSLASNLVAGDTNGKNDIFVHDRQTGATSRVSVDSSGTQGNGDSYEPAISADGRYVAFFSSASNLVAGDTNSVSDIFMHDRQTGATTRVSVDSSGAQGNGNSDYPAISADGRYVAFRSLASNLVAGDNNGFWDIFVHDRQTGATTRVSVDSSGTQGNKCSYYPAISADGRYVAFQSNASNLVAGDNNGFWDIFVHDRQTGATTRVSVDSSGVQGNSNSAYPAISADGRYVAFSSDASNLVAGDTNNARDVFVRKY